LSQQPKLGENQSSEFSMALVAASAEDGKVLQKDLQDCLDQQPDSALVIEVHHPFNEEIQDSQIKNMDNEIPEKKEFQDFQKNEDIQDYQKNEDIQNVQKNFQDLKNNKINGRNPQELQNPGHFDKDSPNLDPQVVNNHLSQNLNLSVKALTKREGGVLCTEL